MPAPLGIDVSPTVTKFRSMTGADTNLTLPAGRFDWEVERVAVIGRFAHKVPIDTAGDYVGGSRSAKTPV
jgi:2,4-didehydro-3-deoxy-L-rhamnonate hydrolase